MRYIALIFVVLVLAGCGGSASTTTGMPSAVPETATVSTAPASPSATPTRVKLTAAQLAAQKAARAKAAAARKAAAAKAAAARVAAENSPISANQWGRVIRNPDAHIGDIYTISGTVAEYNISSNTFASVENAALVAVDANGNDFVVECDASKLGNVQPGQTFTAKVSVVGVVQTQNTVSGGTGEVPDFDASTFTVTG